MIAVVGCGLWGMNIVRTLAKLGNLCAVCDEDLEKGAQLSHDFSVPLLSFSEILDNKEILGVVLSVPVPLHVAFASKALQAKKHVWIEKPMTLAVEEAEHICDLATQYHRKVLVGHVVCYHDAFQEMVRNVKSGTIGDVLTIDAVRRGWGRVCPWEKDALWSLGVHDVAMVLRLTDQSVLYAKRYTQNYVQEGDHISLFLEFSHGVHAKIVSSWAYPIKEQRFIVMGTKGSLVFDDTAPEGQELILYRHTLCDTPPFLSAQRREYLPYRENSSPLTNECQHFVQAIIHDTPIDTSCQDALLGIRILSQAKEMSR
jgi:predicted dehydrogenase